MGMIAGNEGAIATDIDTLLYLDLLLTTPTPESAIIPRTIKLQSTPLTHPPLAQNKSRLCGGQVRCLL
ncbi:hypothetical protein H6G80_04000 [Nostoc sp. FACHB-87]|uniref:hypothetical protein n=1 Tax=Nostocaceae TaxID=1162 RepID=UPI00168A2F10|nr:MULTISPECIES: hypothetical protein [Nostocaceae]MBD2453237.1 hypothetical protein [Nostoc sp. FACHB-87]MBD2474983.1 hypothetical protein [Anabaena sp. FACHB-83]